MIIMAGQHRINITPRLCCDSSRDCPGYRPAVCICHRLISCSCPRYVHNALHAACANLQQ